MLKKLEWELTQLGGGWDEYKTFNFAVTAHHLHVDWISASGTKEQKNRRKKLAAEAVLVLKAWRDIANASKHWQLNPDGERKRVVKEVSEPIIADWYAYFVIGPVLYVSIDSARPSTDELAQVTLRILSWVISSSTPDFPSDLLFALQTILNPL